MYISVGEMYYSYLAAARYIWRINWRDVLFLSGGRHLENEMYISSGKMYILTGEMYISSTSHQLKYTSFHLKYTSPSVSGSRQI